MWSSSKSKQLTLPLFSSYRFTFIDLFSGVGGFRIPLEELGGQCLGYSEIDKNAIQVYEKNFVARSGYAECSLGDIRNIGKLPFDTDIDVIVGGVPCQSWSVAGKLKGFNDPRGQLWFDTIRVIQENKPKAFIFENVKGLADPRNRENLNYLINAFEYLGYKVASKLLNSCDFGLPQNRERIFIVGIRGDIGKVFQFPNPLPNKLKLYNFIDGLENYVAPQKTKLDPTILFGGRIPPSRNRFQREDELNDFFIFCDTRNGHTTIHSWDIIKTTKREQEICYMILRNRRRKKYGNKDGNPLSFKELEELIPKLKLTEIEKLISKKILRYIQNEGYEFVNSKNSTGINGVYRIFLPHSDMIPTLTATGAKDFVATLSIDCQDPVEYKNRFIKEIYKKRKFKPISAREAARLQGFPDWFILPEREDIAKHQLGNAVAVPVVSHLMKTLLSMNLFDKNYAA